MERKERFRVTLVRTVTYSTVETVDATTLEYARMEAKRRANSKSYPWSLDDDDFTTGHVEIVPADQPRRGGRSR